MEPWGWSWIRLDGPWNSDSSLTMAGLGVDSHRQVLGDRHSSVRTPWVHGDGHNSVGTGTALWDGHSCMGTVPAPQGCHMDPGTAHRAAPVPVPPLWPAGDLGPSLGGRAGQWDRHTQAWGHLVPLPTPWNPSAPSQGIWGGTITAKPRVAPQSLGGRKSEFSPIPGSPTPHLCPLCLLPLPLT